MKISDETNNGNDNNISISGAIMLYKQLLEEGTIKIDGAASKRLKNLSAQYKKGKRHFSKRKGEILWLKDLYK